MPRCRVHGQYDGDYCSDCREAEDQATSDREQLLEGLGNVSASHADLIKAINDPGDYVCEHCRRRSLLRNARRCTKCRGEIPLSFWEELDERERKAREERERIQKAIAQQQQREKDEQEQRQRREERHSIEQARRDRGSNFVSGCLLTLVISLLALVGYLFLHVLPIQEGTKEPDIVAGEIPWLDLEGNSECVFDLDNETVTIRVEKITCFGQRSRSGSLRLQLYLAEQEFVPGPGDPLRVAREFVASPVDGLCIADEVLDPIDAGTSIHGVNVQKDLPDEFWKSSGARYPVLVLMEYIDDTKRKIHRYSALRSFSIKAKKSKWWKFWSEFDYSIELGRQPPWIGKSIPKTRHA